MAITVVLEHEPKPLADLAPARSPADLLKHSCPYEFRDDTRVVASSFSNDNFESNAFHPSISSFVRSAIEAWGRHSHLVLRPDDFWFAILVQINFYMSKNAKHLRDRFVSHAGQIELHVSSNSWEEVIDGFDEKLWESLKVDWLTDWIRPGFSTSSRDDDRTAIVLMMGMMKEYFKYSGEVICGIPSITLLGKKKDWARLLSKIDRLKDFGSEPKEYAHRLRPILTRIIRTFDDPNDAATKEFWNQMVQAKVRHHQACEDPSIQYIVSGWVLGLFFWGGSGYKSRQFAYGWPAKGDTPSQLTYDDVQYGTSALEDLPMGYAKAKFRMTGRDTDDADFHGWILAGNIGKRIVADAPRGYNQAIAPKPVSDGADYNATEKDSLNCLSGLLGCFYPKAAKSSRKHAGPTGADGEKQAMAAGGGQQSDRSSHSTIQPLSGWCMMTPQRENNPFTMEGEESEDYGATVDAIDSCDGVEQLGRPMRPRLDR